MGMEGTGRGWDLESGKVTRNCVSCTTPACPRYKQTLTHDLVQHHVKTAAKGSIETHGHRDRHVTQGFSQTAAVDIILCQDV